VVMAVGVLLALLYLRTRNLLLVVGVHALINTPTLVVATPFSVEIVEVLAVLVLLVWPRLTWTSNRRLTHAPAGAAP
jgi:membrane protease YdiL (CAAX protease family)